MSAHGEASDKGILPFVRKGQDRLQHSRQFLRNIAEIPGAFRGVGIIRVKIAGHYHGQLVVVGIADDIGEVHIVRIVSASSVKQIERLIPHPLDVHVFPLLHHVGKGKRGQTNRHIGLHSQML